MLQTLTLITLLFSFIPGPTLQGPADPKTITFSGEFAGSFEVDPRTQDDIRIVN